MNLTSKYTIRELESKATEIAIHIEKLIKAYADEKDSVELPMLSVNDEEKFVKGEVEIGNDEYHEGGLLVKRRYYSNGKSIEYFFDPESEEFLGRFFYMELELSQLDKVGIIKDLSRELLDTQDNITYYDFYLQKGGLKNATQKI